MINLERKEQYYLKTKNGEKIIFEFSYYGFKLAQKYIMDNESELEHPFNDDRITIYYEEVSK